MKIFSLLFAASISLFYITFYLILLFAIFFIRSTLLFRHRSLNCLFFSFFVPLFNFFSVRFFFNTLIFVECVIRDKETEGEKASGKGRKWWEENEICKRKKPSAVLIQWRLNWIHSVTFPADAIVFQSFAFTYG